MVHFTGLLENARHPVGGPCRGTLVLDLCKNRLPAGIRGWAGTATGGHIHVVHISHTHPPKELIQALRKYLLGKIDQLINASNYKCLKSKVKYGLKNALNRVQLLNSESFSALKRHVYVASPGFIRKVKVGRPGKERAHSQRSFLWTYW